MRRHSIPVFTNPNAPSAAEVSTTAGPFPIDCSTEPSSIPQSSAAAAVYHDLQTIPYWYTAVSISREGKETLITTTREEARGPKAKITTPERTRDVV